MEIASPVARNDSKTYCFSGAEKGKISMQWNFTPKDVADGTASYGIEEFRSDFYAEIQHNFPDYSPSDLNMMFDVAYDVCYCTAFRHDLQKLLEHCNNQGMDIDMQYLELIRDANTDNIEMLKAIFARQALELMNDGRSQQEALELIEERHRKILNK